MQLSDRTLSQVHLHARNIGGIDETEISFSPGVTALTGRNATNRTSLLQAIMATLGSDQSSLKGDADEGRAELTLGDETYTRTLTRQNGTVSMSGDPYLDDPELADLFAFLLESNEARRAVARGDDLRDLIMRPVDTDAIQAEIEELKNERQQLDDELSDLESLKQQLPELEEERTQLQDEIAEKRTALAEKEAELEAADADIGESKSEKAALDEKLEELSQTRSRLEDVRYDITTEEESIEAVESEVDDLEDEAADGAEVSEADLSAVTERIQQRREEKQRLESTMAELQTIIQFNEEMLDGTSPELLSALRGGEHDAHSGDSITDQLVDDTKTVVCWTCGTEVEERTIEGTIERLRDLRKEKLADRNSLESEISELRDEKQEIEETRRRRERTEQRRRQLESEIEDRKARLDDLRETRANLMEEVETLEEAVEELEQEEYSDVLNLHKEANQIEFELDRLESDLEDVEDEIAAIESQVEKQEQLEDRREAISDELANLRTRIEQIETRAVEQFNGHMETVLDLLDYDNLERIWIDRTKREVREGRRKSTKSVFDLHVIRSTESGTTYEDTIDHLSESEREVTGLVFALAGYLVHEVYDIVPFILLDSLEAIDSDRIAVLIDYFSESAGYLVAALLPEDAAAVDEKHERVTEI
ncbi:Kinetochore-Ndc80 complex, subunit Spc25 [Haladaptatus paucihalophilus DX253]|uniref:AAA domain-containing protein n=1 Tax=Haladaptatus paucihalophilus DX253 TaxID=797209 RepID=E7QZF6_HALPU|nr:archaea-specific SMC-related protein [Haladaptatus paucihalophilus]EFW90077.1 Kinetochore-Ndc80 complex, subunit Spc25 [Haladaptatus paucihalophilus DX253]SHL04599.1 AAA domain-containing protein [Haladaptatus paucihalophilus DX253]